MNEKETILYDDLTDEEVMDMMGMADFINADPSNQDEAWKITNDSAADWAVRKIKEEQDEYARLNALAHDQISEINMKIEAAEKRMQNKTSYLKSKLAEYFGTVPHRETKTQAKYRLLSGELVFTKEKQTFEKDDETLLAYLKESGNKEFVKTEEKPIWGEFKKLLTIVDGKAVNSETGEVIDCIRISTKEATFDVK